MTSLAYPAMIGGGESSHLHTITRSTRPSTCFLRRATRPMSDQAVLDVADRSRRACARGCGHPTPYALHVFLGHEGAEAGPADRRVVDAAAQHE